jgi:hypothetical protein
MKLKEASNEMVLDVGVGSLDGQWLWRDDDNEEEVGHENTQCNHGDGNRHGISQEKAWFEIGLDEQKEMTKDEIAELWHVLTIAMSVAILGRITNSRIHHHLSLMHSALFWVIASILCNDP